MYSWGSMFIGTQNFHGSKGRNIVGTCNVIGKIKKKKLNKCLFILGGRGCNFVGKDYTQKRRTSVPHEQ